MNKRDQFIFILGPHRSGTSLTAGALHCLQVNLGSGFIAENEENPKGFFEDEDIVNFNDRLLRSINLSWDSFGFLWEEDFSTKKFRPWHNAAVKMVSEKFSCIRISGLKDPRFCLLLPFWKKVISEALEVEISYVLTLREPGQCVISQESRHIKDSDFHLLGRYQIDILLLWITYIYRTLRYVDPDRLVIVSYDSLVEHPERQLQRMARILRLEADQEHVATFCQKLIEPSLNRSESIAQSKRTQNPHLWSSAEKVYSQLKVLSEREKIHREDISSILSALDLEQLKTLCLQQVQYMYGYSYKKIISLRHRLLLFNQDFRNETSKLESSMKSHEELGGQYVLLMGKYELLNCQQQEILNSRSWKLIVAIRRCLYGKNR